MKYRFLVIFLFMAFLFRGQDKVFYLDGSSKFCKVLEVNSDIIKIRDPGGQETIMAKAYLMMVEYGNGVIDVFNLPQEDSEFLPENTNSETPAEKPLNPAQFKHSYFSMNTLALCNADLSGFYEYQPMRQPFTFGVMGAYNFNLRSTIQNAFISSLDNSKKNFDIGATFNYFPQAGDEGAEKISIGLLFKYTDFIFDIKQVDSTSGTGTSSQVVTYTHHKGHQFASILTTSYHLNFKTGFFVRGIFGLGFFKLTGDYKKAYNAYLNENQQRGQPEIKKEYLPKMYVGVNMGFNF